MCLHPGVNPVKDDLLLQQVVYNEFDGLLAKEGEQGYLEILADLFQSFDCPMPQHQLYTFVWEALFKYIANYAFKVDYYKHFVVLCRPPSKIEPPRLELIYALCTWSHRLTIVDLTRKLVMLSVDILFSDLRRVSELCYRPARLMCHLDILATLRATCLLAELLQFIGVFLRVSGHRV